MSALPPVFVLGRFPPPPDGQALMTALSADLLAEAFSVERLVTQAPGTDPLRATPTFSARRAVHFLRLRSHLRARLRQRPEAPVLWHAVSPALLGHARDMLATVPAFAPGQPVIAVLHRAGFERLAEHPLTAPTARWLIRRVDRFVFQTEALAERCAGVIPEAKRRVIGNAVVPELAGTPAEVAEKQRATLARLAEPSPALRLLFLSHSLPEKGYRDVLAALPMLHARGIKAEATFAGRWPDAATRAAFESDVQRAGLGPHVRILGPVTDRQQVRRLHLEADVFVLPTYHPTETQPVAALEALGTGTPVVVTDRTAFHEILEMPPQGGLFVPHRDPAAIADAVARLADLSYWRMASHAARARYESRFSPEAVRAAWTAIVEEVRTPSA